MASHREGLKTPQPKWSGVSGWESIFSTVKAQVPSIDSDEASLSDGEDDELFIFQREDVCCVPDLAEDLIEEEGDPECQGMAVPVTLHSEAWLGAERSPESQTEQGTHITAPEYNREHVTPHINLLERRPETPTPTQSEPSVGPAWSSGEALLENGDGHWHGLQPRDMETLTMLKHSQVDSRAGAQGGSAAAAGQLGCDSLPAEHMGLSLESLQCLEKWDLDSILQQLKEVGDREVPHGMTSEPADSADKISSSFLLAENPSVKREDQIMEQLVQLSAKQSQALAHVRQVALGTEEHLNSESSYRLGLLQQELNMAGGWRQHKKTPTVFIDLRTAAPQDMLTEGERQPEEPAQSEVKEEKLVQNKSQRTGKSLLLQHLRHARRVSSPDVPDLNPPQSNTATEWRGSPDEAAATQIRRKRRLRTREDISKSTPKILEEAESEGRDIREERPQVEERVTHDLPPSPKKGQRSPSTEDLAQREKLAKEKQGRQRMQTQLEGLKPRNSVTGRQPMAEETPVLFHPEASYSPDIGTLPGPASSRGETLLLTIWLSSCGMVMVSGQPSGRSPDSTLSIANAYHVVLAWLLSLVPALKPHGGSDAPFQVLGLQQAWREDGLALYACLTPRDGAEYSSPKIRKHKGKEDLRGTSGFYQQLSLFLSNSTLQSVAWWREEVTGRLQGQAFPLLLDVPAVRLSSIATLNPDPEAVVKAFSSSCGLYWQTLETEEKQSPPYSEMSTDSDTEVVCAVLFDTLLSDPAAFHHALHLVLIAGLDVCGFRLLYPQAATLRSYIDSLPPSYAGDDVQTPPVLALAVRGSRAGEVWGDISGPSDPQLARLTDQHSLHALYGRRRGEPLLHYSRSSGRLLRDLSLWFGGRIPNNGTINIGIQNPPARSTRPRSQSPSDTEQGLSSLQETELYRPPALLTATTKGDVFLLVSPVVPPRAYGDVIDACCRRGFAMQGVRRLRLSAKRAAMLSMSPGQVSTFCPSKPPGQPEDLSCAQLSELRQHCLLVLFRKENAGHHTPALTRGLMNELAERGHLGVIRSSLSHPDGLDPTLCFHVAPHTDSLLQGLGGSLHAVPDPGSITLDMLSKRPFNSDPEVEQVVILTMSGRHTLRRAGHFLRQILCGPLKTQDPNSGSGCQAFEILGLKWLPSLSRLLAKEITPYEVGDRPWQGSVEQLTSSPALLCALRRTHAFTALAHAIRAMVPAAGRGQPQLIMSASPEIAFRQAALIFTDRDLISDPESRSELKYLPPPATSCRAAGGEDRRGQTESLFSYMLSGPPLLYTVLLLKPGSWSRPLAKILRKADLQRFLPVGMKLVTLTPQDAFQILPAEIKQDMLLSQAHGDYLVSGPCLVLCLQRQNAVRKLLDLLGPEDPELGRNQDQFLWRAQYGTSAVQNGLYGSTSYQAAIQDIRKFFPEGLLCDPSPVLEAEQIPRVTCDTLFSGRSQRRTVRNLLSQPALTLELPLTSALCQTTCLLFPPRALHGSPPPYIQGLEQLSGRDFRLTAARLAVFDQSQAQLVTELYSPGDSLSGKFKVLSEGPCLVIAAQRDNAVTCFTSLMDSVSWQRPPRQEFMEGVLRPQTEAQADKMLSCFFDSLTPDSIHQIAPQAS